LVHCVDAGFGESTRPLRTIDATHNKSCVLEHLQVLRDRRLGHLEGRGQLHYGRFSFGETGKNCAPRWIGQSGEGGIEIRNSIHKHYLI
jgi:hypothetical protein